MITGIHHTGLVVSDLDAAAAFFATQGAFAEVLRYRLDDNLETRRQLGIDDAAAEIIMLKGIFGRIELLRFNSAKAVTSQREVYSSGIRHICMQTAMDDVFFDAMEAAGAGTHARPAGLGTGHSYAYIRDPEGNLMELEGAPWAPEGAPHPWYAHTAFVTPDIDRLTDFYAMLTGCEAENRNTFGPDAKFDHVAGLQNIYFHGAWMRLPNAELEFWQYLEPQSLPAPRRQADEPGWNHICFESDALDADYARLAEAGVELQSRPMKMEYFSLFYGRDPDGNLFEILQPASESGSTVSLMQEGVAAELHQARQAFRAAIAVANS